jgi:predicted ATPase
MLGTVAVYLGNLSKARRHFDEGVIQSDMHVEVTLSDGRHPGVSCRAHLSRVRWLLGYPDRGAALSEEAQVLAHKGGQPLDVAFALFLDMLLRQLRREIAATRERAERVAALAREHALPQYSAWAGFLHGWAQAATDSPTGIAEIRLSLTAYERIASELARPHFLALLAEASGNAGLIDEGIVTIEDALACIDRTNERYYEAELHRLRGELFARSGDADQAKGCFQRALEIASRQGARSLELRAAASLAQLSLQVGVRVNASIA